MFLRSRVFKERYVLKRHTDGQPMKLLTEGLVLLLGRVKHSYKFAARGPIGRHLDLES